MVEKVRVEELGHEPDTERGEYDKRYYEIAHGAEMSWLKEDVQSIALGLAGRDGSSGLFEAIGQPEPASIPPEILNAQQVYYEQNNPDSAYLEE